MRIKKGKYGARVDRNTAAAMVVVIVKEVMDAFNVDYELSSMLEGEHMKGSLHFVGLAWDWSIRSRISRAVGEDIHLRLMDNLGDDFDVAYTQTKKLYHVEFQPKRSMGKL